jgi:hypothetical protein
MAIPGAKSGLALLAALQHKLGVPITAGPKFAKKYKQSSAVTGGPTAVGPGPKAGSSGGSSALAPSVGIAGAGIASTSIRKGGFSDPGAKFARSGKSVGTIAASSGVAKLSTTGATSAVTKLGAKKMALPLAIMGAAAAGKTLASIGKFGVSRLLGGKVGIAATGAVLAAPTAARAIGGAIARRPATSLAIGGGATGTALALGGAFGGQAFSPGVEVIGGWNTGTAQFARLSNGSFAAQRKDGSWRTYRAYRPVCIPKKWNSRSMGRVSRALRSQRKTASTVMRMTGGMPKR